jgi:hypothetical protein
MADPAVTFTLKLPAPEDGSLLRQMEQNGIGRGADFAAFALSDDLVKMREAGTFWVVEAVPR